MRAEKLYLQDMLEAAQLIGEFCADIQYIDFLKNVMLESAVLLQLIVIGEAAAHLSHEFQERHTEIVWADIIGFRNFAVHAYFMVDWHVVWVTAVVDVPALEMQVKKISAEETAYDN